MDGRTSGLRAVEPALTQYVERLRQRFDLAAVIVIGSRARGDHWQESDLDLLVVSPDFAAIPRRFERIGLLLVEWRGPVALEPIGMTPEEFARCEGLLTWDALEEGIPLVDTGIFAEVQRTFEDWKDRGYLQRTPRGWKYDVEVLEAYWRQKESK
jgi:predicted nucleotidyltransferase